MGIEGIKLDCSFDERMLNHANETGREKDDLKKWTWEYGEFDRMIQESLYPWSISPSETHYSLSATHPGLERP